MNTTEGSAVEVSTPWGWKAKLFGMDTKIVLLAIIMLLGTAMVVWNFEEDRRVAREERGKFGDQHKITQSLLGTVITNQRAMMEQIKDQQANNRSELSEITYILTLSQQERDRLKLEMPNTLRRKLNSSR